MGVCDQDRTLYYESDEYSKQIPPKWLNDMETNSYRSDVDMNGKIYDPLQIGG